MGSLDRKVALVTGATRAMGEAIAHRLARDGATFLGVGRGADRGRQSLGASAPTGYRQTSWPLPAARGE
jgi:NAD(P)-dependent dehydrogenase (short-subunit alcohol dehydrogenase family)